MPLYLSWEQVALRIALACLASFVIGLNRDEHGQRAGVRTTMLVCVASTLAMLQANLLPRIAGMQETGTAAPAVRVSYYDHLAAQQ